METVCQNEIYRNSTTGTCMTRDICFRKGQIRDKRHDVLIRKVNKSVVSCFHNLFYEVLGFNYQRSTGILFCPLSIIGVCCT
jgi:hypothetical protein